MARVEDDQLRLTEACEFLFRRADEHGVHEECVIRPRADEADLDAILWVLAREGVDAIKALLRVEVIERALAADSESVVIARDIHRAPPNVVLRFGMLDHTLVFGRTFGLESTRTTKRTRARCSGSSSSSFSRAARCRICCASKR